MNAATAERWNPRYLAYCWATGAASPEEARERDWQEHGGARNLPFIRWSNRHLEEWRRHSGQAGPLDHGAYDAWLTEKYPAPDAGQLALPLAA